MLGTLPCDRLACHPGGGGGGVIPLFASCFMQEIIRLGAVVIFLWGSGVKFPICESDYSCEVAA